MLNDQGLVSSEQEYRFYDWELMPDKILSTVIYRGGNNSGGHFFVLHGFSGDYFNINYQKKAVPLHAN